MGTVLNLLSGTPTLYIASDGEALPELDDLTPPAKTITVGGSWSAVGFTLEDFEFTYEPTYEEIFVNEHQAPMQSVLVKEMLKLSLVLAEKDFTAWSQTMNAATLATVAAGADQTAQDTLVVGDGTSAIKALLLVGTSPESGSRVIHIPHAKQTGPSKLVMAKGHKGIGVEFTALTDTSQSAGARLFQAYDITAVASS